MGENFATEVLLFSKSFEHKIKTEATAIGILSSFRPILNYVSENEGASQLAISEAVGFCPPTISVTLKKMEQRGLVRRTTRKGSGRTVRVYLTDEGREKLEQLNEIIQREQRECLQNIDGNKLAAAYEVINQMQKNAI